ncbi:MAG: hypothetical protein EH225_11880 [Calditrichaeota bacterium]|nr:MAG: hypothetical protein EH225_11880 [Calditrichota bacterium]
MNPPVGIANSVSFNVDYDPVDTLYFAHQSKFDMVQIYINEAMLEEKQKLVELVDRIKEMPLSTVYFHAHGEFNREFAGSDYKVKLFNFLNRFENSRLIHHFDENEDLDNIIQLVDQLHADNRRMYLENYFQKQGASNAEKNLRKYTAVFSLVNSFESKIFPVIDIPRFFHKDIEFTDETSLNWCYQILNFFGNRRMPIVLHLIDALDPKQDRNDYCPVGKGYIPYKEIFNFIRKNRVQIEGIILEFLEKINPLKSRDNIQALLNAGK